MAPTSLALRHRHRRAWWAASLCLVDVGLLAWVDGSLHEPWQRLVSVLARLTCSFGFILAVNIAREARKQSQKVFPPPLPSQEPAT